MNHGVRALSCFNGFFQFHLATFVLGIGDDDNCFATGFGSEFFTARQVDRIVESCAGDLPRSDWSRISHPGSLIRYVDPGLMNGAFQLAAFVREIR